MDILAHIDRFEKTGSISATGRRYKLATAKLLTADDYFEAFIDPGHENFKTETSRAATELLQEALVDGGSKVETAPDDFIEKWTASGTGHRAGFSGAPLDVTKRISEPGFMDGRSSIRLAVKLPVTCGYESVKSIVDAEHNQAIRSPEAIQSPQLFTQLLCGVLGIGYDAAILPTINVLTLSYGAKILRKPGWQEGAAYGVLLLELEVRESGVTDFRLGATRPLTNSGFQNLVARQSTDAGIEDLPFLSRWRLDNYMHHLLLDSRKWSCDDKVLDVGCGYSGLPRQLAERHGLEMWAVDDTDLSGWSRSYQDSSEISNKVQYVQELVGTPDSSKLPKAYFDVIYSKVAVHFSPLPQDNVYRHIKSLLRPVPGSEIIFLIGTASPFESAPEHTLEKMEEITRLETQAQAVVLSGRFDETFWRELESRVMPRLVSPFLYCAYIMNVMGVSGLVPASLRVKTYFSDPDTFYDAFYTPAHNACYQRDVSQLQVATSHTGAMVITLGYV